MHKEKGIAYIYSLRAWDDDNSTITHHHDDSVPEQAGKD